MVEDCPPVMAHKWQGDVNLVGRTRLSQKILRCAQDDMLPHDILPHPELLSLVGPRPFPNLPPLRYPGIARQGSVLLSQNLLQHARDFRIELRSGAASQLVKGPGGIARRLVMALGNNSVVGIYNSDDTCTQGNR